MKSVKRYVITVWLGCLAAVVAGAIGQRGLALCFISISLMFLMLVIIVLERRRQAAQQKQLSEIRKIMSELAHQNVRREKSLGLVFRELQKISQETCGERSPMHARNENILATNLIALRVAKQEIIACLEDKAVFHDGGNAK